MESALIFAHDHKRTDPTKELNNGENSNAEESEEEKRGHNKSRDIVMVLVMIGMGRVSVFKMPVHSFVTTPSGLSEKVEKSEELESSFTSSRAELFFELSFLDMRRHFDLVFEVRMMRVIIFFPRVMMVVMRRSW